MEFKDYYAILGLQPTATAEVIKRTCRKLARKYHPDVSQESDAEARFKDVQEAKQVLIDPERRAAYDDLLQRRASGQPFDGPGGGEGGFEFSGRGMPDDAAFSDFFESLFGRGGGATGARSGNARRGGARQAPGEDHHAQIHIDLLDAYRGAQRTLSLRLPVIDAQGHGAFVDRTLDVQIPRGVREGQHLRLAGQGAAGHGGGAAGDLYLQVHIRPHPQFRVHERDVTIDLPLAPWEAALGATVPAPTPEGEVQLTVPPGSTAGRRLRLKGRGLPGTPPGDLYAVLTIVLPPAATAPEQAAYAALAQAFAGFDPATPTEAPTPMADLHRDPVVGLVVEEQVVFSLTELGRAAGARRDDLLLLVDEGLLDPAGAGPDDWRFSGTALAQARQALRLSQELELDLRAAVLVMTLLAEIARLRGRFAHR